MTKILYIPTGTILTFKQRDSIIRTFIYEESVYMTKIALVESNNLHNLDPKRYLKIDSAEKFILSMCYKNHLDRHKYIKQYNKIPRICITEEFEVIND